LSGAEAAALRKQLGRRVREARKLLGISMRKLAAIMGRSPSWVREVEAGAQYAPHYLVLTLAQAIPRPLAWFYGHAVEGEAQQIRSSLARENPAYPFGWTGPAPPPRWEGWQSSIPEATWVEVWRIPDARRRRQKLNALYNRWLSLRHDPATSQGLLFAEGP